MNRLPLLLVASASLPATATTVSRVARADPAPPVDVALHGAPSPHRAFSVEWNPLTLFIDKISFNVVVVPGDHHALVLSPFYTWAKTNAYATGIDANGNPLMDANGNPYTLNVLAQTFHGFGGELGYRYYFDKGGPRGFFLGPSLLLAGITATAGNGTQTSFSDVGFAADAGYEALIADTIAISVGAGAQYVLTSKSIPEQQLPASIYANNALRPRLLLSLGYGF
ncbi:MAG: hypothetical protein ABSC94_23430 [Polyangiaceae bacterium]